MPPQLVTRDRIERAARVYRSNTDAARAMGIAHQTFVRLCREYGVETPGGRKSRLRREMKERNDG